MILLALACACNAGAQSLPRDESRREIPPIQDNSFLMEEAYNQEEGVVQHINAFQRMRGGDWIATFTQEYPVPRQRHQLSYTIAYQRVEGDSGARSGLGDVALNYRYQFAGSGEALFACAPRITLLLPAGDEKAGLGSGGVGVQGAVATSTVLSSKFVAHTNLGGTYTWSARNARGQKSSLRAYNAGQSVVWMARADFNVLVEAVWSWQQEVVAAGRARGSDSFFISPGVRWAYNFPSGLQIVPGIALPIGAGPSRGDRSVFVYLSFEHPMWKAR
jgi:hypothetical protein